MGERCQKSCCLRGRPLGLSECPKREGILAMQTHTCTEKKNNYAKLQGTGLCPFLCSQLVSVTAQKSLLGGLEGLAGLGDAAIWSACPSPRRGHAAWEQRGQSPPCWGGMK